MHRLALAFFLLAPVPLVLAAQDAAAPTGVYVTDPAHTSLTWKISHFGLSSYTARFTGVEARLDWNAEKPETSDLTVTIDPLSVQTDFPFPEKEDFDGKIGRGEDFLAAKPITFKSRRIKVTGEGQATVTGDLTFRGETHPASLDVRFNGSVAEHPMDKKPRLGFSATGVVHRTDWGLGFAVPALGEDVDLLIETEFVPPQS
ncbi:YceI family protein [Rhizobium sp. AAP43]|uniref:YceI family protein n=1 Tax=Rhizobium sp. AAP43 TaxID=1523420 RepID=UPI0006B8CC30|nr:YceI family protein [Rhizobium sp. AAP43]